MKKIIVLTYVIIVSFLFITGCDTEKSSEPPLTEQESRRMITEIKTSVEEETSIAIAIAMAEALTSIKTTKTETAIDYTNDSGSVSITGTLSFDSDNPNGLPMNYTINITLIDFIPTLSTNITLMNGSATWIIYMEAVDTLSCFYSGDVTIIYKGEEYKCSMSYELTVTGSTYTYSGSYTVNDYVYTYNYTYTY